MFGMAQMLDDRGLVRIGVALNQGLLQLEPAAFLARLPDASRIRRSATTVNRSGLANLSGESGKTSFSPVGMVDPASDSRTKHTPHR
jgi:hypothetical protein